MSPDSITSPPRHARRGADPGRRRALAILSGSAAALVVPVGIGAHAAAAATSDPQDGKLGPRNVMRDAGAGMHAGPDTAFGLSSFTLNPLSISCGVGSLGNSPGVVPMTAGLPTGAATTGPFAMMMYATRIDTYTIDRKRGHLFSEGRMRSITTAGSAVVEDVDHPYVAEGIDGRGRAIDVFLLHFRTPFWTPGANPMATVSSFRPDWAMFGSTIVLGEINVDRSER